MIHFEVTQCPDENVLQAFQFYQNQIYLGRTTGDLWINDAALSPSHLLLEVIGKELLIHPQRDVEFYLINGKRATAIRKLKVNDTVTIGRTTIKIRAFSETEMLTKKDILNKKLNKLIEENSTRLTVIEQLTKRMKQ